MKIFQVVNGKCAWQTPFGDISEAIVRFPKGCVFVTAPDYVFKGWGYKAEDDDGNPITGDDRFIKPIPPEGFIYDDDTGKFLPESEKAAILKKAQIKKQEENKALFASFLKDHPLLYTNGKYYGVSLEDQNEISLNLTQYQLQVQAGIANPVLEWHAVSEGCEPWAVEDLTALAIAISNYIYPWFHKMQEYKTAIFNATSKEEVEALQIVYMTEEEIEAANN